MIIEQLPTYQYYDMEFYKCLSTDNDFIPISALVHGEKISNSKGQVLIYSLYINANKYATSNVRNFQSFCNSLNQINSNDTRLIQAKIQRVYKSVFGTIIYDEKIEQGQIRSKPLLLLTVKRKHLFEVQRINPNSSHLCLLVQNNFKDDPEHFKLYKNVLKNYIEPISKSIDVLYTHSIKNCCFNMDSFKTPVFNGIQERLEYANRVNKLIYDTLRD